MAQHLTSEQREQIAHRCRQVIDRFDHRGALREDDVRVWVSEVVAMHGEAAVWHATRAGGFGGSDIGVLVKNHASVRADHMSSAHDIVASKLLRRLPDEDSAVLRRGHENEPLHAQRFYAKYGAVRDVEAFDTLKSAQAVRRWMRYSPDEVCLMPSAEPNPMLGGRRLIRVLGDYKAPTVVDDADAISVQYACQLHQGAMLARASGLHLDRMLLSQFDWAKWDLRDDWVDHNPELDQAILAAGDHYWQYVLRGEVPPYVFRARFDDKEGLAERLAEHGNRVARLKALSSALKKELDASELVIREAFADKRLAGLSMQIGDLKVGTAVGVDREQAMAVFTEAQIDACRAKGATKTWDADAMEARLRELGNDMRRFRKDGLDADKVYAMAAELGLDADALMKESLRLSPPAQFVDDARDLLLTAFPRVTEGGAQAQALEHQPEAAAEQAAALVAAEQAIQEIREGALSERQAPRAT